jgi:hypothetical protein
MPDELPPCGLYRTTKPLCDHISEGRLVYYHNHGNPSAAAYLPERWSLNRAQFAKQGHPIPDGDIAKTLEPLPEEGFYVVEETFFCCENECREYQTDQLVQLGYNSKAEPILFQPELVEGNFAIPEHGTRINLERVQKIRRLKVRESRASADTRH